MVAVKSHEADAFVQRKHRAVALFLVHGLDEGLIRERARALAVGALDDPSDSLSLIRMDGDAIAADPLKLADEANAMGLFGGGGRRAIWVELGNRNILPAIEGLFSAPPQDAVVVIEAGNLKKGAPLRNLFEKSDFAAAVECYADDERTLGRLIDEEAQRAGLKVSAGAREALQAMLGADRMASRAELAKLTLYAARDGTITEEHVETIVADASALALDAAIDGAFDGRTGAIEATAQRAFAHGVDPGMLLGAVLRHATLLHRAVLDIEAGKAAAEVVAVATRGVFFKRKAAVERQIRGWTGEKLARMIAATHEALIRLRREGRLAEMIAVRALWTIAVAAPKGRR